MSPTSSSPRLRLFLSHVSLQFLAKNASASQASCKRRTWVHEEEIADAMLNQAEDYTPQYSEVPMHKTLRLQGINILSDQQTPIHTLA